MQTGLWMGATLKEIAEAAGVSRGTVDRVLHEREGVNEATRKRVLSVIKDMDYNPNLLARALKSSNRILRIGVIVPSEENPFYIDVNKGIDEAKRSAASFGIEVLRCKLENYNAEQLVTCIDSLEEAGVNGIAMVAVDAPSVQKRVNDLPDSIPLITFNSDIAGTKRMCFVGNDHLTAGRTAGCLMNLVARRPGKIALLISHIGFRAHTERIEGFSQVIRERGCAGVELIGPYMTYESEARAYELVKGLLRDERDLLGIYIAGSGPQAAGRALAESGRAGEVHMVCHDLLPETIEHVRDGVVDFTIGQEAFEQGYMPIEIFKDYYMLGRRPVMNRIFTRIDIRTRENIAFKGYEVFTGLYTKKREAF